ncbi:protein phosphatase 2C domain-containing protein [Saccharopolyspora rosea]|uniref:Protein phosphatase 2C domain-containing protein n=1 Tax=Saccharopolyspora rosea TaxID=524884 RepID=A0ABW3G167_9PSEU
MQVSYASIPTPGRTNEDCVVAGPRWVAVLDGATAPSGVDSGCAHDVPWLVRHLAAALAKNLTASDGPLPDLLADAISETCAAHAATCDLTNPSSPSATVSVLRENGTVVEHLVLADSPIVLDIGGDVVAIVDDRLDHLPGYTVDEVRRHRNAPGGFWVASTVPEAAHRALHGTHPTADVRRAAVLTDGASRYVDRFALADWRGLLDLLQRHGPAELLTRVRAAEAIETPDQRRRHRGKPHDDATAALVVW